MGYLWSIFTFQGGCSAVSDAVSWVGVKVKDVGTTTAPQAQGLTARMLATRMRRISHFRITPLRLLNVERRSLNTRSSPTSTCLQVGQKGGGGFVHSEGGDFVQEFQERIQIVAGSWANQQAKKNCRQP